MHFSTCHRVSSPSPHEHSPLCLSVLKYRGIVEKLQKMRNFAKQQSITLKIRQYYTQRWTMTMKSFDQIQCYNSVCWCNVVCTLQKRKNNKYMISVEESIFFLSQLIVVWNDLWHKLQKQLQCKFQCILFVVFEAIKLQCIIGKAQLS